MIPYLTLNTILDNFLCHLNNEQIYLFHFLDPIFDVFVLKRVYTQPYRILVNVLYLALL
jgi:hypothetical protein